MGLTLSNRELGDKLLQSGTRSSSINDVIGLLTKIRQYTIVDNTGANSFLSNDGYLANNAYRGRTITETNDKGIVVFDGVLDTPELVIDRGFRINLNAKEPLALFLKKPVETNAIFAQQGSNPYSEFVVNGNFAAGVNTLSITYDGASPSPVLIPNNSLLTFSDTLVPRYMIMSSTSTGSPARTNSIVLDRPLEANITTGQRLRVSVPASSTPTSELKRVMTALGLGARIGGSFDVLSAIDTAASRFFWINIQIEDEIESGEHIRQILKMANLFLYESAPGILDVRPLPAWNGIELTRTISEDEFIPPIKIYEAKDKLVIGYDCLFRNNGTVEIASDDVDPFYVNEHAGVNRFRPIDLNNNNIASYKYLYDNSTTADYYGLQNIEYYKTPRLRLTGRIKSSYSGNILQEIGIDLLKDFGATLAVAPNRFFVNEPATVNEFTYNERTKQYQSVTLEFTNYYAPAIPRLIGLDLSLPVIESVAYNEKTLLVFLESTTDDLFVQVALADKKTIILDSIVTVVGTLGQITRQLFNFADNYYVRFYRKKHKLKSAKTEWQLVTTFYSFEDAEYDESYYDLSLYD